MEVIGADGSPFTLEKVIELKNRVLHEAFGKEGGRQQAYRRVDRLSVPSSEELLPLQLHA
jgi:hypothetical protein